MKKMLRFLIYLVLLSGIIIPVRVDAARGDGGYEGGISSGQTPSSTIYEYQEVCFVSGEPIVFKGTLTIKKAAKQGKISTTYTYNLKNNDKAATLTRVLVTDTSLTKKENGQTIEETSITGRPSESIKIGNTLYTLSRYDLTRSAIIDEKPAISYYAGNMWGRKVYQVGNITGAGTVTVDVTGEYYGYDQYWSNAEAIKLKYLITSEQKKGQKVDKWGGQAEVAISSTTTREMTYVDNQPDQISFEGGYVESLYNNSVLEYRSSLPEFDKNGVSTDNIIEDSGSLQLDSLPVFKRLLVPDLNSIRGYWYENDIKALYSLEIFKEDERAFNPQQYMTRAEFTDALVRAAKEVPKDESLVKQTSFVTVAQTRSAKQSEVVSPFKDVSVTDQYFNSINSAYQRGMISGKSDGMFYPDEYITLADAITVFIRALGLENLSPGPDAVTNFRDNDLIPQYARSYVYVAEKIGLVMGDEMGNLNPTENLTKARAAVLINRLIDYMRTGIREDYREHIVNY